jgi:hypothetical protein
MGMIKKPEALGRLRETANHDSQVKHVAQIVHSCRFQGLRELTSLS